MRREASPELDEVDYRLLTALQANSRIPVKDLAKAANVSVPTARSRLQRLIELGVIRFTVAVDAGKVVGGISAFVTIRAKVPDVSSIAQSLGQLDEVDAIYQTTGEHDLVVKVSVPDIRSFDEFLTRKLGQMAGVEYMRSDIVVDTVKERYGFTVRPGFGVRLFCALCKKQIAGEMVRGTIGEHEYFFCCQTCATTFQKEREAITGKEVR